MIIVLTFIVACSAEKNEELLKEETNVKVAEEMAEEPIVDEKMLPIVGTYE